ncbi:MAG: zinc ABC transporter substrate-binding protein [Clostridia bacterium]|nr:zinc ABC transporter substrate-binding protein [Clostridia bacterium]
MKKIICAIIALVMLTGILAGCGNDDGKKDGISIVTTVFPVYDWVEELLGDKAEDAELTMLLDDGVDLHNYQPTTDDIIKIGACDLFIYVGGESDSWVEDVLKNSTNESRIVINLMDEMEEMLEAAISHHEEEAGEESDHGHDHEHELDEHIWLSLRNAAEACRIIADGLSRADEANKDTYSQNLTAYTEKLNSLDARYSEAVENAKNKTVVFTDRFPFIYLCHDYGIEYYAAFDGCSTETAATPEVIAGLANKIDELSLGYVMNIDGSELMDFTNTVIGATTAKNAKIVSVNSLQAVTAADVADGVDYLSVMESNLASFTEALN